MQKNVILKTKLDPEKDLRGLGARTRFYEGKVRDCYSIGDFYAVVTTDRISSFDVVLPFGVPYAGMIRNMIANHFLDATKDIVPNWKICSPHPMVTIGWKCEPYQVEMIIRGILTGSLWKLYKEKGPEGVMAKYGVEVPAGMKENQLFDTPIITPTTKAEAGHDEPITREDIISKGLIPADEYAKIEDYTRKLFQRGQEMAEKMGLVLVDTKYEFGKKDGIIYLIDEIHTPDSSRYFYAENYMAALERELSPIQLSKEFVRDWLRDNGFEGKEGQTPPLPDDKKIEEFSKLYKELYSVITGKKFEGPVYETEHETDFQHEEMIRSILYKVEQLCEPPVAIIIGSDSDLPTMKPAMDTLGKFEIPYSLHILSAHRVPGEVKDFVKKIGAKIIIAGAGLAAHLPGVIASFTTKPVIGIPIQAANSVSFDSILSIIQMPPGIPVATVGLNNAKNAALLALQMLGIEDNEISDLLIKDRKKMGTEVLNKNKNIKRMDYPFCMKNEINK